MLICLNVIPGVCLLFECVLWTRKNCGWFDLVWLQHLQQRLAHSKQSSVSVSWENGKSINVLKKYIILDSFKGNWEVTNRHILGAKFTLSTKVEFMCVCLQCTSMTSSCQLIKVLFINVRYS